MTLNLKFGEIWLADLSLKNGTEMGKVRPVLIVQNSELLKNSHPSTLIIPLTTNLIDNAEPLRIRVKAQNNLHKDSDLVIDQLGAIDNKRFIRDPLAVCDEELMDKVRRAIFEVVG